jgi:hypothetical protein
MISKRLRAIVSLIDYRGGWPKGKSFKTGGVARLCTEETKTGFALLAHAAVEAKEERQDRVQAGRLEGEPIREKL